MNIQELLNKYNFHTKKSLGQNFLHDEYFLHEIADAGNITPDDTIVEIGPGLGPLTDLLCEKAARVIAIEKDPTLIPILQDRFSEQSKLELINQDALEFNPTDHKLINYKIIANIPYYITSPLINHFLKNQFLSDTPNPPSTLVLLTQKEVAEKICPPKKLNVLALNIQTFAKAEIIDFVPATAFIPAPKVDSAIIRITPHEEPIISQELLPYYFQLIHSTFSQKRKKISNTLAKNILSAPNPKPIPRLQPEEINTILSNAEISPDFRPENLTIQDWKNLAKEFKKKSE